MAPVIQLDSFYPDRDTAEHLDEYLIFFITGNPGLISFYDNFLNNLHNRLQSSAKSSSKVFHIYGRSLAGFEDHEPPFEEEEGIRRHEFIGSSRSQTPYSLQQEVDIIWNTLSKQRIGRGRKQGQCFTGTILIGHSVGSYILLELLRLSKMEQESMNIVAGICLFPTVTHISKSPSGLKFSALCRIPNFPRIASSLAKLLLLLLPRIVLKALVRLITGMPDAAAETTTDFLESKTGIYQALYMARDEMETITEDKWDEELWGVENPKGTHTPKLVFYFGQNDHWVAEHTRDELIKARARTERDSQSKPLMMIDQDGIPHSFCINHSQIVAGKVKVWIDHIVGNN